MRSQIWRSRASCWSSLPTTTSRRGCSASPGEDNRAQGRRASNVDLALPPADGSTGHRQGPGVFTGGKVVKLPPYPDNFDYIERCLFESLHDGEKGPLFQAIGHSLRPKGVPYQVAKSGANVVTVFPVAAVPDSIGYGLLGTGRRPGRSWRSSRPSCFGKPGSTLRRRLSAPPRSPPSAAGTYPLAEWLG